MAFYHAFYNEENRRLADRLPFHRFLDDTVDGVTLPITRTMVQEPTEEFGFLHECAIVEFHGVLYAAWYACPQHELSGRTPICGRHSTDDGRTWSELAVWCEPTENIMYCPPVFGVEDDRLYMFVNQMVAPDHMHSLDLYVLNGDRFDLLWTRPIPFKLNTHVVTLPNGKRMLPGRCAELDGFPNTPAVLISDDGKLDTAWRLVQIADNGDLPDGERLVHPEITVMQADGTLYMFCRNDRRTVPLVYLSADNGESWSPATAHDIPYTSSKIYAGDLADGRHYLVANVEEFDRSRLVLFLTNGNSARFSKRLTLFDSRTAPYREAVACHYPAAVECDGKLQIIATLNYTWERRGAVLFTVPLTKATV